MFEASKSRAHLLPYLLGSGLDIGSGDDPITPQVHQWDLPDGDAQTLLGLIEQFDFVFSSHCLEHLLDPFEAVRRWWELVKPYGYLIIIVPDEDLYEQGLWPSIYNGDHKNTFTPSKLNSWSPVSISMPDLLTSLPDHRLESLRLNDSGYNYKLGQVDQTQLGACAQIEMIVQKLPQRETPMIGNWAGVSFGGYFNAS